LHHQLEVAPSERAAEPGGRLGGGVVVVKELGVGRGGAARDDRPNVLAVERRTSVQVATLRGRTNSDASHHQVKIQ
jgi:hypothetical protein